MDEPKICDGCTLDEEVVAEDKWRAEHPEPEELSGEELARLRGWDLQAVRDSQIVLVTAIDSLDSLRRKS